MASKRQPKQSPKPKRTLKKTEKVPQKTGAKPIYEEHPEILTKVAQFISLGVSNRDACAQAGLSEPTFYSYLQQVRDNPEAAPQALVEFSENITRAKAQANTKAVVAFRSGLEPQNVDEEIVETFSETRLRKNKDGSETPYTYTKTTKRVVKRQNPPDWRAGKDWLILRDHEHWSVKQAVDVTSKGEQITGSLSTNDKIELVALMKAYDQQQLEDAAQGE